MKSRITTQEMQVLKKRGVLIKKIAEIAGITSPTVCMRLNLEYYREVRKNWRDDHPGYDKQRIGYHTKWQKNHPQYRIRNEKDRLIRQEQTVPGAIKRNKLWTNRDLSYLKKHATDMTALELATKLKRTYEGVKHAASAHKIKIRKSRQNIKTPNL
ncbi:MAG: hypothetical protein Q7R86_01985 [bacterium]|nr:hypothetical protein [bacterium]